MREAIKDLKSRVGVRGALVMTNDGVVVAADLCDGLKPESVAALTSALIGGTSAASKNLNLGAIQRVTLTAGFGRLVILPFDELNLLVVTEPNLDLDLTMLEIAGPAERIRELSRINTPA